MLQRVEVTGIFLDNLIDNTKYLSYRFIQGYEYVLIHHIFIFSYFSKCLMDNSVNRLPYCKTMLSPPIFAILPRAGEALVLCSQ